MKQTATDRMFSRRKLLGGLALLVCTQPAWAIFGVWRRAARRTVIVAGAATTAAVATESAAASQEAAAAASAQAAANASAAAARASQTRTPQQRLQELQSLYDQGLISASDYESAKAKIVNQIAQ
ncbi:SHOCT domain-containing protein [Accumulibacter sp.]|uniref:SHOCT domain-containing protein n=1 Tax=Accumulibacter sp. TaxID=2053492 RepID=UPI00260B6969|nr:SHOCT domain-containing protein [Accumulibacter sp.]